MYHSELNTDGLYIIWPDFTRRKIKVEIQHKQSMSAMCTQNRRRHCFPLVSPGNSGTVEKL